MEGCVAGKVDAGESEAGLLDQYWEQGDNTLCALLRVELEPDTRAPGSAQGLVQVWAPCCLSAPPSGYMQACMLPSAPAVGGAGAGRA